MKKKSTLRRMWRILRPYRWTLLFLLSLVVGSNLLALVAPLLSGRAIDAIGDVPGGVKFSAVFTNCFWMLVCYAVSAAVSYGTAAWLIRVGEAISRDLREAAFHRLTELPVSYFDTHPVGDLISRICYDVDTVNASLSTDLLQVCTSLVTVLGSLVMLLIISPGLSLVFAVTVPLSVVLTRRQMKRIHSLFRERSRKLGGMNGFAEERISGMRTFRTYGVERQSTAQFETCNAAASDAYYRAEYESAVLGPLVNFINNLSLALISVFGGLLYLSTSISLGNLASFVLYSRKFSGPIRETANLLSDLQASVAAAERVLDLLDTAPEPTDPPGSLAPEHLRGSVSFEHVNFSYVPGKPVLRNFSADIPEGSLTAVVGFTGAGKTTLISLLLRFYELSGGRILLDGEPLSQYARRSLRRRFALVLQDTWLHGGTIAENIAYGAPSASMEQIRQAAKDALAHSFIRSLPRGYDTVLTDEGVHLSKGQRQLLAIARCLLTDADVVILDEATSNVDTETEERIQRAMERLRAHKTCIVIAHRLTTVLNADQILLMENGCVAERGTHTDLLRMNGRYAELYRAQFMGACGKEKPINS